MRETSEGVYGVSSSWAYGWLYIATPVITDAPNSRNIMTRSSQ